MIDDVKSDPNGRYGNHFHKYFAFSTKKEFEPVEVEGYNGVLYEAIDYTYLSCACGAAKKTRVSEDE